MKKNYFSMSVLILLNAVLAFALSSCASQECKYCDSCRCEEIFSKNNKYAFRIVEPKSEEFTSTPEKPLKVKLDFDYDLAKGKNAFIVRIPSWNDYSWQEHIKLNHPYVDTITAEMFFDGKYEIRYYLMPEHAGTWSYQRALAGVKFDIEVKGSINETQKDNIRACVDKVCDSIFANDVKKLKALLPTKQELKDLELKLKNHSDDSKEAYELLEKLSSNKFNEKLEKNFEGLQKLIQKENLDIKKLESYLYKDECVLLKSSAFKLAFSGIYFKDKNFSVQPWCSFLVVDNKVYLAEFSIDPRLLKE